MQACSWVSRQILIVISHVVTKTYLVKVIKHEGGNTDDGPMLTDVEPQ